MWRAVPFVVLLSVCPEVRAQDVARGQAVRVACRHDASQTYACYVPTSYRPGKEVPILFCFAPNANGMAFVRLFKDVCERKGWIVAGSNNARNGPGGPIIASMKAMWKDTHDRFSINDKRCYSSGFSGGSGMAFNMARVHADEFAGVIPMAVASSWAEDTPDIPKHISVYFIIGSQDAVHYVKKHAATLKERGHKAEVKVFPGGHVLPPKGVAEGAVEWLEKNAPKTRAAGKALKPTQLELREDVAKRLKTAVRRAAKGELGAALRTSRRILQEPKAEAGEKADAKYIADEIEKRLAELTTEADRLLEGKQPYEAHRLLGEIYKAFEGTPEAGAAQKQRKEIEGDFKKELAAGKLFNRGLEYERKRRKDQARKIFKQVVDKHPGTEYAKRAKERLE